MHDEIDRLFEKPFGGWLAPAGSLMEGWTPAVDVHEDKNNVFVRAELPGMKKEDITVSVSGDTLSIAGERKEESEFKDAQSFRSERFFGHFQRQIPLPMAVEADKIHASYKDGVLTVTCPKTEEARRKQIEVQGE
ncbi:MAG TPA: Hsp20/alpha crystallin family protein [Bacillota bacterium]|nr:Hsp20/alpha crystallin family protein [Bacillota bacterium]